MRESTVRGPAIDLGEFERRLRAPERKSAAAADPLSELARLMQGEEAAAADPYSRILAEPRAPQLARPAPEPELRGSYDEAPAITPEPRYEEHEVYYEPSLDEAYPEPTFAEARPAYQGAEAGWADDEQYLDYGDAPEPPEEARGLRRYLRPWHAIAVITLIAIGSIGWGFAHRSGSSGSKEIATITAPEGPVKVKPTADTDANAPDASGAAVLDRKENEQVKQVLNNQEQAVEPTVVPKALTVGNGPVAAPHEAAPAPMMPPPKKVKTVTVRPDGTRVDDAAALPPAVSKATRPAAPAEPPVAEKTATPAAASAKTTTPKVAKPKTPPKPAKLAAAPADDAAAPEPVDAPAEPAAAAAPISKGGYAVQFGAAGSEAEAKAMIKSVSSKYGASLGGYKPSFYQATVGDKTVYRVRVGGVSKESAAAICGKVKAGGGSCFVAGN